MIVDWIKDFMAAIHYGVPDESPDWERVAAVEERLTQIEQDVESLKATVEANASVKWGRRKGDGLWWD